jgi:hypothetical protein
LKKIILLLALSLVFSSCGEKDNVTKEKQGSTAEVVVQIPKIDKKGPFLAAKLSITKAIETMARENPKAESDEKFKMAKATIENFQASEVTLFLSSGEALPQASLLIKANKEKLQNLEQHPLLSAVLIKTEENLYSFKEELIPKEAKDSLGPYQLKIENDYALLIPKGSQLTLSALEGSSAYMKADVLFQKNNSISLTCIIPDRLTFNLSDIILENEAIGENRIAEQICKVFDGLLDQFKESVEKIDYFTLAVNMTPENIQLELEQQFRDNSVGLNTHAALTGDSQEMDFDFVSDMKGILATDKLQKDFTYKTGLLKGSFSWKKEDSQSVLRNLGGLIMGSVFNVPDPVASIGEIEVAYETDTPEISDIAQIKKDLPKLLQNAAFPDKFHGPSEQLTVHFEEIPGFGFRGNSLKYEFVELTDKSGTVIPLKAKEKSSSDTFQSFIWIKFAEKRKEFETGKLKIKLISEVAPVIEKFEFKKGENDKVIKSKHAAIKLAYIDRDAVKILVKGPDKVKVVAYDKAGKVLKKKSVNGFSQNTKANYMGEVERIKILVFGEKQNIEVVTMLDLSPIELAKEPSDVKRTRKGYKSTFYDDFSLSELKKLKVIKEEDPRRGTRLLIDLNKKSPSLNAEWNLFAMKDNKVENLTTSSNAYNGEMSWSMRKYKDHTPFTGAITFKVKTGVDLFELTAPKDGTSTSLRTKAGIEMKVKFDKNHVIITAPNMRRDNFMAYDLNGTILKSDTQRSENKNNVSTTTYVYWGTVAKIKFQTSTEEVEHTLFFDLPSDVDPKLIKKTKDGLALHTKLLDTLKVIRSARNAHPVSYGDNLSFLHYSNQSISKAIADSDPLGAVSYGYTLTPFSGYKFTLAEGKINYSKKKEAFANKYPRKKKLTINGKEIEVNAYSGSYSLPYIVAYPVDKSQPTYFMTGNEIFWKVTSEDLSYFPQNGRDDGWNRLYIK